MNPDKRQRLGGAVVLGFAAHTANLFAQQRLQRILQAPRGRLVMRRGQHGGGILTPGFRGGRVVAARQQLKLQRTTRIEMLGRRRHFGRHLQPQHRFGGIALRGRLQRLGPGVAGATGDGAAQLLRARHLIGLALLPGTQQLRQRFTVRLRGELAQLRLGLLDCVALGAEGRIAQAGSTRAAVVAWTTVTEATTITAIAEAAASFSARPAARIPATGSAIAAVAELAASATRRRRFGATGARAVVAAHGDQRLGGRRLRRWSRCGFSAVVTHLAFRRLSHGVA